MKNKKIIISMCAVFGLVVSMFTIQGLAADNVLMSMAKQNVSADEAYEQRKINSKSDGFFDIINSEILEKDYGYDTNEKVKDEVDKQIKSIKENNPDAVSEYGVEDEMELLKKSGTYLQIQEEQYTKETYEKEYVTEKSLKKLYDEKAGEMTSYYVIKLDDTTFDADETKMEEAKKNIEEKLAKATDDDVIEIFKELIKEYPGSTDDKNEEKSISRDEVDETLLKKLDKYKYLEFSKKAIDIDGVYYYILKTDKGERASFESSKERLKDIQYDNAVSDNSFLTEYLLVKLREKNDISFANKEDKKIYDANTEQVIADYNDANESKDGDN